MNVESYGSYVEIELINGKILRGILMPRSELDPDDIVERGVGDAAVLVAREYIVPTFEN